MQSATDILKAAEEGEIRLVETLLKMYPSQVDILHMGHTALHAAARSGNVDVMKTLIHHNPKPDIDFPDSRDCTPLHYAVKGNQPDAVLLLMKAGANLKEEDDCGQTPPDIAFNQKIKECVKIFIDEGVTFKSKVSTFQNNTCTHSHKQECGKNAGKEEEEPVQSKSKDLCMHCGERDKFVKFEPCGCIVLCFECSFINAACMNCGEPIEKYTFTETSAANSLIKYIKYTRKEIPRLNSLHICRICEDAPINCVLNCGHMFCISCLRRIKTQVTQNPIPRPPWNCPYCDKSSRYTKLHADWLN
ncbi:uncharacterized protein LOC120339687 [Styela clava]